MPQTDNREDNWAGVRGPVVITLVVLLLGGAGYFVWSQRVERAREARDQAVIEAEAARHRAAQQQPPPAP